MVKFSEIVIKENIDSDLKNLILRLLEDNPHNRYTMSDVKVRLIQFRKIHGSLRMESLYYLMLMKKL